MVAIQMVLEGNIKVFLSFPGGFWKKMEYVWRGEWKGRVPKPACGGMKMRELVRDWVHYKWKRVAVRPAWASGWARG